MSARAFALSFALALAACAPPAADQDAPAHAGDVGEPAPTNPDAAALGGAPQSGVWTYNADEGTSAAGFGEPQSEYTLAIICNAPAAHVTLTYSHELSPAQDTQLGFITEARTMRFAARSFVEGLPSVTAELDAAAPGVRADLAALSARQTRFAVEVMGEASVLPWDESIARVLNECAG